MILNLIQQLFPFNMKGDLKSNGVLIKKDFISCLIITARKPEVLENLLIHLSKQSLGKENFELVILDNTESGLGDLVDRFATSLSIRYIVNNSKVVMPGELRNKTIEQSRGEYLLFLDDDTRIPQEDFLEKAMRILKDSAGDLVIPYGKALLLTAPGSYKYLDPYSYATRCCFYKRTMIEKTGGFYDELAAYEDIDLGIRSFLLGAKIIKTNELEYEHPCLFFSTLQKPIAIGQSILKLRKHYPWPCWLLIYFNALRFLPLGLLPTMRNRQWFKISLGVLIAPFISKEHTYRP